MMGHSDYGKLGLPEKVVQSDRRYAVKPTADKRAMKGFCDIMDGDKRIKIKHVACGFKHTACITEDGELYTWGEGRNGQLGHSDFKNYAVPTKVELSIKVEKVQCGANFTIILDDQKRLYAFGDNRYGQLGITGLDSVVLGHPAGIQTFLKKVQDFACGEDHAAYID